MNKTSKHDKFSHGIKGWLDGQSQLEDAIDKNVMRKLISWGLSGLAIWTD